MVEKRKLPPRERREPAAKRRASGVTPQPQPSRRKASTPVIIPSPVPEPEPVLEPVDEPLPTKIKDAEALPTLFKPQPPTLSDREYQSIAESAVLLASLERSKKKWLSDGIFERYWTKPKKTKREQIEGKNPPKESMSKVGPCKIIIEPHHFDGMLYTVKDPNAKNPVQIPPAQRHMVHYGPPNAYHQYQAYPPPNQLRQPSPYNYHPSPHPPSANPPAHQPHSQPRTPQQPPPVRRPEQAQPPPPQPPKPSPDPVIQMLATRAASNPELKALMRVVASSKASQEQLRAFQAHIDELNAIIKSREQQQRQQQQQSQPQSQQQPRQPPQQPQQQPQQPQAAPPPVQSNTQNTPQASPPPNPSQTPASAAPQGPAPNNTAQVKTEPGTPATPATPVAAPAPSQQPPPAEAGPASAPGPSPSPASAPTPSPAPSSNAPATASAPRPVPPAHPSPQSGSPYAAPPHYPPYPQSPYQAAPPVKARSNSQYGPPGAYYHQTGPPPPPPKPAIKAVVFEFTSPLTPYGSSSSGHAGSGDRYLFPEYSILEFLHGGTCVIVSFLIVRKVDPDTKFPIETASDIPPKTKGRSTKSKKADKDKDKGKSSLPSTPGPETEGDKDKEKDTSTGKESDGKELSQDDGSKVATGQKPADGEDKAKKETKPKAEEDSNLKEYYQPMTMRIWSTKPSILEPLSRIVKPPAEVRKYMEEVMDRAERAPEGFLAFRLPREGVDTSKEGKELENKSAAVAASRGVTPRGVPGSVSVPRTSRSRSKARTTTTEEDSVTEYEQEEGEEEEEEDEAEEEELKDSYDAPSGLVPLHV